VSTLHRNQESLTIDLDRIFIFRRYDRAVISFDQLVTLSTIGAGLVLLGLWPGLLQSWADGISDVSKLLSIRLGGARRSSGRGSEVEPYWFALAGVAMILLTILAYISN
jgi:hypothetical protein